MKLVHSAVVCSSQENAERFYEGILGLKKIKGFTLDKELVQQIFGTSQESLLLLYGNEAFAIEVFVPASTPERKSAFVHLCLEVKGREEFLGNCEKAGLPVNRVARQDSLITFVEDYDGNLFEIKEMPC
jgi:catechol 2,3-dioxygenase-like lactoylglutathione lyase family enzyme